MTENRASSQPYPEIAATHIRNLSTVNEQLPSLLRKTASTISLLTQHPIAEGSESTAALATPQGRKDLLQSSTYALFIQINTIRTTLKNQVQDLEAEKVVPAEVTRYIAGPRGEGQTDEDREREKLKDSENSVTNGGLGGLDVGMLNANVRSGQGGGGEDEVLGRIEKVLNGLDNGPKNEGDDMVVDD